MTKLTKKHWLIVAGLVLAAVLVGGLVFAFTREGEVEEVTQEPARRRISEPTNIIPVEERPFVTIATDANGRNLILSFLEIKKSADAVEYELEYQAGTLLQGAFGQVELDTVPATTNIRLGSCSAGGACTYHEDVRGGSLTLRFSGPENYALKQDWRFFDNQGREEQVASKDAKFQLESSVISRIRYLIVYNSPGYPGELDGELVSDIYSLTASSPLSGTGELVMRATQEGELTILGFDGSDWIEFETEVDGKTATAEVDLLEAYLVVRKP